MLLNKEELKNKIIYIAAVVGVLPDHAVGVGIG